MGRRLAEDRRGSIALLLGLALPVLLGLAGAAVDYARWIRQKGELRSAADAAALAAARELTLSSSSEARVKAVAEAVVRSHIPPSPGVAEVAVSTATLAEQSGVRVVLRQGAQQILSHFIAKRPMEIELAATAKISGKRKLCLLALEPAAQKAVSLDSNSMLTAQDCDVHSNSRSPSGVSTNGNARLTASLTCSAGGISGRGVVGQKLTDCPAVPDPLASRPPPMVGACKETRLLLDNKGTLSLPFLMSPGTYCGGIKIDGNSVVVFRPGVYVIKDGPLQIDSNSIVRGDHAGFYFVGTVKEPFVFRAAVNASVDLTAPKDGPLAGIMFFEDRAAPALRPFEVFSNNARNLLGTLYIPRGRFVVNNTTALADRSAYTVIVANQIELNSHPNLTLNTNYHQSDVPVPKGLGPLGGSVALSE